MERIRDKRKGLLFCLILAAVTIIAFEPVRHNDFVNYDDFSYVTKNPNVREGLSWESARWAFTTPHVANWHPLTWLSHMVDCELFGLEPFGHHLTNLLLHIANTLLLFLILKKMTGSIWPSAFVAAVFALHPLHVESVAWVAERKDVLSGLFWMLTIAAYIRYAERASVLSYIAVVVSLALGLMAKPMLVTLPFILLLLDYWPLKRLNLSGKSLSANRGTNVSLKYLLAEKIPLFILIIVSSVITFMVQRGAGAVFEIGQMSFISRISNAVVAYVSYISKMLYPGSLAVLYPFSPNGLPPWKPTVAALMLICASAVIIFKLRRRYLTAGWLWYIGTIVPVIGLVQVGSQRMADRYTYLPSLGIFIMFAWGVPELLAKWRYRKQILVVCAVFVLAGSVIFTRRQVQYWKNSDTLYQHTLAVTKNNSIINNNYGCYLFDSGRLDEAVDKFETALQINPNYLMARANIGNTFLKQGKYNEAIANFKQALLLKEDLPNVYSNLGRAYAGLERYELAIQNYDKAIKLNPNQQNARYHLGLTLLAQKKYVEAIAQFNNVLSVKKGSPDLYNNLALAYFKLEDNRRAAANWKEALMLKPESPEVLNNLAWLLATSDDANFREPAQALKYAEKACDLTQYAEPEKLDTLAVAYAAVGNFPQAIATTEKAIELAISQGEKELADELQSRIALYKAGKPYP